MPNKYEEGEEFLEVSFELPKKDVKNVMKVAEDIMARFKDKPIFNLKVISCKMYKEPRRLSVSKDDYAYTVFNSKQREQILRDKTGDVE